MVEAPAPVALVVDDSAPGRTFLRALLKRAGYVVEVAESGEQALALFVPGKFDIVFMDILMPGIDGIETARHLKSLSGVFFTPVIFVTGEDDEESLVRAIDAGGDDFLTKPVTPGVLLAKLKAMARIREVHERTRQLYALVVEDQEMAKEVFDRAVQSRTTSPAGLSSRLIPAGVFSGDLLLSAVSPDGRLVVLFGDFTGHGLAAALGAMPVSETFRAVVAQNLTLEAMLDQLNRRVVEALPRGHFLAAHLLSVPRDLSAFTVANCGMPPLLLCGPQGVRQRIHSATFALGILADASFGDAVRVVEIEPGERLILASDGVTEATGKDAEAFGDTRLEALLAAPDRSGNDVPSRVAAALDNFRGDTPFSDDVSIVELLLTDQLFPADIEALR